MLNHLHIENVAVIKELDVDLSDGFTVLTGETGAGKSVIIDAIKLLTGSKVSRDLIRSGEELAVVEAIFDGLGEHQTARLSELGVSAPDGELEVSVSLGIDGRSSAKINRRTVTKTVLREVCRGLVSIHGQNDSRALYDEDSYIRLLDDYASSESLISEYATIYDQIIEYRRRLSALEQDDAALARERDMLTYQIKDIDSARLKRGEEETLSEELLRLENAEKINKQVKLSYKILKGAENGGASYLLARASGALAQITDVIPSASELSARLRDMSIEIDDMAEQVYDLGVDADEDPTERLDKIQSRLERINSLKRRYGESVERILQFRESAAQRLDEIELSDEKCAEYRERIKVLSKNAREIADRITALRKNAARVASQKITEVLLYLDMPSVEFEISVMPADDLTPLGLDRVSFLVATNVGEPKKPMAEIASGGELSRIMLAIRSILNEKDNVGCAIYDEVDTGISGKTSRKIGLKLWDISRCGQVLCVTHSAQIATLADTHLLISKVEQDGRAFTSLRSLEGEQRVEEAARILGGINITEAQRQAARDMLADKK